MYQEQRPTCVTVIGWAWIVMGSLMGISTLMALPAIFAWQEMGVSAGGGFPPFFRLFPVALLAQLLVGVTGGVAGAAFLRLRARARTVLEGLTWLLLVGVVAFMVFWLDGWLSMATSASGAPDGFAAMGAMMGVVVTLVYAVPLIIMLVYLRGPKVRGAVTA